MAASYDEDWFQRIIKINMAFGSVVLIEAQVHFGTTGSADTILSTTGIPLPPPNGQATQVLTIPASKASKGQPAIPGSATVLQLFTNFAKDYIAQIPINLAPFKKAGQGNPTLTINFPASQGHKPYHIYTWHSSFTSEFFGTTFGPFQGSFSGADSSNAAAEAAAQSNIKNGRYFNNDPFFPDYYYYVSYMTIETPEQPELKITWSYEARLYNTDMQHYPLDKHGKPATYKVVASGSGGGEKAPIVKSIKL